VIGYVKISAHLICVMKQHMATGFGICMVTLACYSAIQFVV